MSRTALPATTSAAAVLAADLSFVAVFDLGPLSAHMALHIALMNVAAPLAAVLLARKAVPRVSGAATLWALAAIQIVLLWMWHAPSLQREVMQSLVVQAVMHASLFLIALWFWRALLRLSAVASWQAIPVLLFTGKLACLLAALLIFAPRLLYAVPAHIHNHAAGYWALTPLADQQLAGLLMIAACPLSYLIAGVIFAAQRIADLEHISTTSRSRPFSAAK